MPPKGHEMRRSQNVRTKTGAACLDSMDALLGISKKMSENQAVVAFLGTSKNI